MGLRLMRDGGVQRNTNARIALFCLGAGIACVGIATDQRWIITVAIVVLLVGWLLRFVGRDTGT